MTRAIAARARKATAQVDAAENECWAILAQAAEATAETTKEAMQAPVCALQQQAISLLWLQRSLATDIAEVRKGGVSAMRWDTKISKLSPRLNILQ